MRTIENHDDLLPLAAGRSSHRISLYLPVDPTPTGQHANALRLSAAFDLAAAGLHERGARDGGVVRQLEDARASADELLGSLDAPVRALAGFGDEQGWAWAALPREIDEILRVGPHFALRPLIRALDRGTRFRVLALSAGRVDAYEGGPGGLHSVAVAGLPGSLEDALGSEIEARGLSFRAERPVPGQRALAPIYHGHGGASDERALDRERFHRVLADALESTWGREPIPIVLASEVRSAAEFRKHANLPGLLDDELRGNPEDLSREELHARTWPIVEAALEARERELAAGYEKAAQVGKAIDGDLDALALAAIGGRVRRLWVEEGARIAGRIDETSGRVVDATAGDEDALDALVAQVLRCAGEVRVVDAGGTPTGNACCAELR